MAEQQGNPRRSVALAVALFAVAIAVFAAAFYLLDGYALVQDLMGGETVEAVDGPGNTSETTNQSSADELTLPDGMSQEFALRLWQEQVDSQDSIERLLAGDAARILVKDSSLEQDAAQLDVEVVFVDGTSAPGTISMKRFDEIWYFASISGLREGRTGGLADVVSTPEGNAEETDLPALGDVDIQLLNTMIAEQTKSASVTERYVDGDITDIEITGIDGGPNSSTVNVEMSGVGNVSTGEVIAVLGDIDGEDGWFIVRFTGAGSDNGS